MLEPVAKRPQRFDPPWTGGGFTLFAESHAVNEHVEACRQKAAECEQKALAATKQEMGRLYWQLAGLWRDIGRLSSDLEDERDRRASHSP